MTAAAGIYKIAAPSGGFYIGSAIDMARRRRAHLSDLRRGQHPNQALQHAAAKYGVDALRFSTMIRCAPADLLLYEQLAIDAFRPKYNICKIAGNTLGTRRSADSRARMTAAHIGRPLSAEHRNAIGRAHVGATRSSTAKAAMSAAATLRFSNAENRTAISRSRKGAVFTDEHRRKLQIAHRGNSCAKGHALSEQSRARIALKLKGRKRSPEAIAKHRATLAAKRLTT